jgi:hypothetical protein
MAQNKKTAAAQTERPRDEDGRFTEKADAAKTQAATGGAKGKDAPAKSKDGGSGKAPSKKR